MCVQIYKPKNYTIPKKFILRSWARNSHGGGISIIQNGKIKTFKTFSLDEFYNIYKAYENEKMILHFRSATAGNISINNIHPHSFGYKNEHVCFHNGTIFQLTGDYYNSDSYLFAKNFLTRWVEKWGFESDRFKYLIKRYVGDNNKLLLMSNEGKVLIINEHLGNWKNGVYFSNHDYRFFRSFDKRTYKIYKNRIKKYLHKLIDNL